MTSSTEDTTRKAQLDTAFEQAKRGDFDKAGTIVAYLTDKNPEIRVKAAWYSQQIGIPSAIKNLANMAIKDPISDNRNQAIHALAGVGRPEVIPTLIAALNDEDDERRSDARTALYHLLGKQVLPLLADEFERDSDEARRLANWWEERSGNFNNSWVYFMGEAVTPESFIKELKVKRPAIPDQILFALRDWTGEDFGQEPIAKVISKWEKWWGNHKQEYIVGRRYFYGHLVPLDFGKDK